MPLEHHYCGDEVWRAFAGVCATDWHQCDFQESLLEAVQSDLLLAQALYRVRGDQAVKSLCEPWPVLDGRSPKECLSSPPGLMALRESLMRFPY